MALNTTDMEYKFKKVSTMMHTFMKIKAEEISTRKCKAMLTHLYTKHNLLSCCGSKIRVARNILSNDMVKL